MYKTAVDTVTQNQQTVQCEVRVLTDIGQNVEDINERVTQNQKAVL